MSVVKGIVTGVDRTGITQKKARGESEEAALLIVAKSTKELE